MFLLLCQMNVFHWHIVDTHSFPVEMLREKTMMMTQYGAYDAASIYTQDNIKDILEYATYRGTLTAQICKHDILHI